VTGEPEFQEIGKIAREEGGDRVVLGVGFKISSKESYGSAVYALGGGKRKDDTTKSKGSVIQR